MKKYSVEEVISYLTGENGHFEYEPSVGGWVYYLHHDGSKLLDSMNGAERTFTTRARNIDSIEEEANEKYPDDEDAATDYFWSIVYDLEAESDDFRAAAEDLTAQLNSWLKEASED